MEAVYRHIPLFSSGKYRLARETFPFARRILPTKFYLTSLPDAHSCTFFDRLVSSKEETYEKEKENSPSFFSSRQAKEACLGNRRAIPILCADASIIIYTYLYTCVYTDTPIPIQSKSIIKVGKPGYKIGLVSHPRKEECYAYYTHEIVLKEEKEYK